MGSPWVLRLQRLTFIACRCCWPDIRVYWLVEIASQTCVAWECMGLAVWSFANVAHRQASYLLLYGVR